jgi:3-isopropylmalate dehydratase large subunit
MLQQISPTVNSARSPNVNNYYLSLPNWSSTDKIVGGGTIVGSSRGAPQPTPPSKTSQFQTINAQETIDNNRMTPSNRFPSTLYDKIWSTHIVHEQDNDTALIYIDAHIVYEITSPQAFDGLRSAYRKLRRPDLTLSTVDHNIPTKSRRNFKSVSTFISEPQSKLQVSTLETNVRDFELTYFGLGDQRQGIVHVIGPEQGFTTPGKVIACGDSHTGTNGAFGTLALGIGTSEVEHILATQTLLLQKSNNMRIWIEGTLTEGVVAKDLMLHIIGKIGLRAMLSSMRAQQFDQ